MLNRILLFITLFLVIPDTYPITITQEVADDILFDLTSIAPTEAGDYFEDFYERDATTLNVVTVLPTTSWKVSAKLSVFIHSGSEKIKVRLKRTGNGTGLIIPSGGVSFETINQTTYTDLFSGTGSRLNIPIKTRIEGVGVSDEFGTFDTTIEYKVESYLLPIE